MFNKVEVIIHRCLHRLRHRKRKHGFIAIKLEMSKAYDRVEWVFIEKMMVNLGFSDRWVTLIMRCISSVSCSFMLNGEDLLGDETQTR